MIHSRLSMTKVFTTSPEPSASKCGGMMSFYSTLLKVVKVLANVPIRLTPAGWQFRMLSWEFVGCVLVYLAMVPIYWVVINDIYPLIQAPAEQSSTYFNKQILYEMAVALMAPYLVIPLTCWVDASSTAAYLNRCSGFKIMFEKTVGKPLTFALKTKQLQVYTAFCIISQNIAVQLIVPPYLAFWKTPAFSFNIAVLCIYLSYWVCLTDCLGQAGEAISSCIQHELLTKRCDAKRMVRYKQLWLELSQLTTDAASHFYLTLSVPILLTFFLITLSVYGMFASLREPIFVAYYAICVSLNTLPLFLLCDNAYSAMIKVRSFLEVIDESPPVITLGGYAVFDRRFLHAAGATIATYLVVIFQFRMSLHVNEKTSAVDGIEGEDPTANITLYSLY